ncbi:uncharacterized protein LOC144703874 isoform X2 [Wolffia australiana]
MEEPSKDLLQMEKIPDVLESSLLVCKGGDAEADEGRRKTRRQKKESRSEETLRTVPAISSSVLGRVKNFLGAMAEANEKLQNAVQESCSEDYNIEVLRGNENEYIELDLLLGLTDLHTPEAVAAAEAAARGGRCVPSTLAEEGSSSSDEEDSNEEDNPGRVEKRPKITVLD